jgi:hypothetical protein
MSAEQQRTPVRALGLSPGEFGHYDETGEVRDHVITMSAVAIGQCIEQQGFSGAEQDSAIRKARKELNRQAARRRREIAEENS